MISSVSPTKDFLVDLEGKTIHIVSSPGFPHWNELSPATRLLAAGIAQTTGRIPQSPKVLLMGCGHAASGVYLVKNFPASTLWLVDLTINALSAARDTLQANKVNGAHFAARETELIDQQENFDLALMELPKGRRMTRRWLVESYLVIKPEGVLLLAGANAEGIHAAVKDAEGLFGPASILAYKKGSRVARLTKHSAGPTPPGWATEPGIAPHSWIELDFSLRNIHLSLRSLPGVFSSQGLDEGTRLLLEHLEVPAGAHVLDAGCGYGVIGLFAARLYAEKVDLADNHLLSILCTRENIDRNSITNAEAHLVDTTVSFPDIGYTHVLSNPPFHTGNLVDKSAAQAFITLARQSLAQGGELILVANRFLRYDRLMQELFGNLTILAETGKFWVLSSRNNAGM
jgi:16S rRNA (guanine1207-N2)-methyltransferase